MVGIVLYQCERLKGVHDPQWTLHPELPAPFKHNRRHSCQIRKKIILNFNFIRIERQDE